MPGRPWSGTSAFLAIGAALVLVVPFANTGAYVAMIAALVCLAVVCVERPGAERLRDPFAVLMGLAFLAISLSIVLSRRDGSDLIMIFDSIPLIMAMWLYVPLSQVPSRMLIERGAVLAGLGLVLGFGAGLTDVLVAGVGRANGFGGSAIYFGNFAVMLSFLAVMPALGKTRSHLYLLGLPLLGLCVALMSGSRSSLLIFGALALVLLWHLQRAETLRASWWRIAAMGLPVLAALVLGGLWLGLFDRVIVAIDQALEIARTGTSADRSIGLRLDFYTAGLKTIGEVPWYGYGPRHGFNEAARHMLIARPNTGGHIGHLHNDIINFLVFYGVLGAFALAAIVAAPLANLRRFRRNAPMPARYGVWVVTVTLLASGLTDGNFVYEAPKVMFAFATAWVCAIMASHFREQSA